MNENGISILMVGIMVAGMLGSILRYRRSRITEVGNTQSKLSLPPEPASPWRGMLSFVLCCMLVIVWGMMIGFMVGVFSNLFYLVFIFPLLIGFGNRALIEDLIKRAKIRQPARIVILSVLSVVAIYGMLHYGRYAGFVVSASVEISSGLSEALEDENLSLAKAFLDYALEEETGHSGFPGYLLYRASEGASIGRLTRSRSFNLGPVLTRLYWLLEFGIILGLTVRRGGKTTRVSFCEACGNRYGGEKHLGGTASANESFLLELIGQKDFSGLRSLMEPNAELPSLEVYYQGCQVCGKSPSRLVVRHASQGTRGLQFREASQMVLQPTESALLLSQLSVSGD